MPSKDPLTSLASSLWERLTETDSAGTRDRPGYSFNRIKFYIQRDVENLLNTVCAPLPLPPDSPELEKSLLTYGLPDLGSLEALTREQRETIGALVTETLNRHEPRLRNVKTTLIDTTESGSRTIRYHISAEYCADPAPPVAFDTELQLSTGRYKIEPKP